MVGLSLQQAIVEVDDFETDWIIKIINSFIGILLRFWVYRNFSSCAHSHLSLSPAGFIFISYSFGFRPWIFDAQGNWNDLIPKGYFRFESSQAEPVAIVFPFIAHISYLLDFYWAHLLLSVDTLVCWLDWSLPNIFQENLLFTV